MVGGLEDLEGVETHAMTGVARSNQEVCRGVKEVGRVTIQYRKCTHDHTRTGIWTALSLSPYVNSGGEDRVLGRSSLSASFLEVASFYDLVFPAHYFTFWYVCGFNRKGALQP